MSKIAADLLKILVPTYPGKTIIKPAAFVEPFLFDNKKPELREFQVYQQLRQMPTVESQFIGVLSDLFQVKSLITMEQVENIISANPGYDVYIFNPFPYENKIFYNLWSHGEFWHPGIVQITEDALRECKLNWDLLGQNRNDDNKASFCNYWIGSSRFFYLYLEFLNEVSIKLLLDNRALAETDYAKGATALFPFILERLFTSYLYHHPEIRVYSYDIGSIFTLQEMAAYPLQVDWVNEMSRLASTNDRLYNNKWPKEIVDHFHFETYSVYGKLTDQGLSKRLRY